jgi:hypothetical protein
MDLGIYQALEQQKCRIQMDGRGVDRKLETILESALQALSSQEAILYRSAGEHVDKKITTS